MVPFLMSRRLRAKSVKPLASRPAPSLEPLEDRTVPAFSPMAEMTSARVEAEESLRVLLVSDRAVDVSRVNAALVPGTVLIDYDPAVSTLDGILGRLTSVTTSRGRRIDQLDVMAHGSAGEISLTATATLSGATLARDAGWYQAIGGLLSDDASIRLFSCSTAAGAEGRQFVDGIAGLTGADVFASDDDVGAGRGADFAFEYRAGSAAEPHATIAESALASLISDRLVGDWAESNETLETATYLGMAGGLNWSGLSIHSSTDVDFLKFRLNTVGVGGNTVGINFTHASGDLDIALYNSAGTFISSSTGVVNNEQISIAGLGVGDYVLKVYGYAGAVNTYSFVASGPSLGGSFDFLETNDQSQFAFTIPSIAGGFNLNGMNIHQSSDVDWFYFRLNDTGRAGDYARINFTHANADLDMTLYNASLTQVGSATGTGNQESISLQGLAAGYYYLRVYAFSFTSLNNFNAEFLGPSSPSNDSFESNNTLGTASFLGTLTGARTLDNLILTGSDQDWFSFTTTRAGTSADFARLEFIHASGDVDFGLYNGSGTLLRSSTGVSDSEQISLDGLAAGTYYVQAYGYNNAANSNYRLKLEWAAGPAADSLEVNDSLGTATNLGTLSAATVRNGLSIHNASDADWFRFTTTTAGSTGHSVRIDFTHAAGDVDMQLYDANGVLLNTSAGVSDQESLSLSGLAAGTYHVRVYGYAGATNPNYRLTITPPSGPAADALESNDTFAGARDLGTLRGANTYSQLSIHNGSDQDFFRFALAGAGVTGHFAQIDFQHAQGDLDIQLLSASGAVIRQSTSTTNSERIGLEGLAAGQYTLRVYGYNGATNPNYTLRFDTPTGAGIAADRLEGNDTLGAATVVRSGNGSTLAGPASYDGLSIHNGSDLDFFRFTTVATAGAPHNVRINFTHANGDLALDLFDGAGNWIRSSNGTSDSEQVTLNGLAAGTYAVRVRAAVAGVANQYSIAFDTPTGVSATDAWTIFVYMTASDLDEYAGRDINEMENAAARLGGSVNIVTLWDQSARGNVAPFATGNGAQTAWTTTGRAVMAGDTNVSRIATTFELIGEQNTGLASTLTSFLQWGATVAPAQRYALIMWDHGSGLGGSNYDDRDNVARDNLTIAETVAALSAGGVPRMNVIAYDACLMAMAEVGYSFRTLTDVFVASEEIIAGDGYNYATAFNTLLTNPSAVGAEQFATGLRDSYQAQYVGGTNTADTLSAARTSSYTAFASSLNSFVTSTATASAGELTAMRTARTGAIAFHDANFRDLGAFMRSIANNTSAIGAGIRNAATGVLNSISNLIFTRTTDRRGSSGVAINLPGAASSYYPTGYSDFLSATGWVTFLNRLNGSSATRTTSGVGAADWAESNDVVADATQLNTLTGANNRIGSLSLHEPGDTDWFRFSTSAAGTINLNFASTGGQSATISLFDAAGVTQLATGSGPSAFATLGGAAAGTYLVRVTSTQAIDDYALTIGVPDQLVGDWAGDNSTRDKAYQLSDLGGPAVYTGLQLAAGATDWFSFNTLRLPESRGYTIGVETGAGSPASLLVIDGSGNIVARAYSATGRPEIEFLASGQYERCELRVINHGGASGYTLTITPTRRESLAGRTAGGQWFVAENSGLNTFQSNLWTTWVEGAGWLDVNSGDFNGDGLADIVGRTASGEWYVGRNTGAGAFNNVLFGNWNPGANWRDVRFGDFNDDGRLDVAGRTSSGQWWVGISNGSSFTTSLWAGWNESAGWTDTRVGDFNGDGRADLASRTAAGQWWVAASTGGSFSTTFFGVWNPGAGWRDVSVSDFNGDGTADIAGRTATGQWWIGVSNGSTFATTLFAAWNEAAVWNDVRVGDFNGDGLDDIVGRAASGDLWVARSTGSSMTTTLFGAWNPSAGWTDTRVGDFNGDGRTDLASRTSAGEWWVALARPDFTFNTTLFGAWAPGAGWQAVQSLRTS